MTSNTETASLPKITLPTEVGPEARVWIYQADRAFRPEECDALEKACAAFTTEWQAHGTNLRASSSILFDRFICLFADESHQNATGCSIDSSVRFIQQIEKQLDLSLMDRMQVAWLKDGMVQTSTLSGFSEKLKGGEINNDTIVFNNLVATKAEMENSWMVPLKASWHARMIS